jgi:hypothetical protein
MQHGMSPREKDSYRHGINERSIGCLSKAEFHRLGCIIRGHLRGSVLLIHSCT